MGLEPPSAAPSACVLETRDLGVHFGGHHAVDGVSCRFESGTVTTIVGPNGAGKTTYFNLISGQIKATTGSVWLSGHDISSHGPARRSQLGIGRAFQLTNLFPRLSVAENLRLAVQSRAGVGLNLVSVWQSHRRLIERADAVMEQVRLTAKRGQTAASLSHGDQRKLEVGMLMALDPLIYMFDEPTAGMSLDDVPVILELIAALRHRRDRTILLVEHKMDVVRSLSDRIVVLHNGRLIADGNPGAVMALPAVQQAYLGRVEESSHV